MLLCIVKAASPAPGPYFIPKIGKETVEDNKHIALMEMIWKLHISPLFTSHYQELSLIATPTAKDPGLSRATMCPDKTLLIPLLDGDGKEIVG